VTATDSEVRELVRIAAAVAREAGALVLGAYRRPKQVSYKGAVDLVTEFDVASEELIRDRLARETPHIAFVAEESGGTAGDGLTWYVDPIDGTTNYAHGHPMWCVSIGLTCEGVCLAGAVEAPAIMTTWTGGVGLASERNGEPCAVSHAGVIDAALLATGFPYDRRTSSEDNLAAFFALKKLALGIRRCGSAAIDMCMVADGTYDGYWERKLKPWDWAAGAAIVRAAGGTVTSFSGDAPELAKGYVVATNGELHAPLLDALGQVG
jgi:myo-inositol-1(or 4)-monophosphatase